MLHLHLQAWLLPQAGTPWLLTVENLQVWAGRR
jgi:hypothetical protein